MTQGVVASEVADGIAILRLRGAGEGNAVDAAVESGMAAALAETSALPGLRAIVLTAEGEDFSVGRAPRSLVFEDRAALNRALERRVELGRQLLELPVPSIAVLHGRAAGPGLAWALLCDLRLARADTQIAFPECAEGLVPEYASLARLAQMVGVGVALDLALTGRVLTAPEALDLGLVARVVPLGEDLRSAAMELTRPLLTGPAFSVKMARSVVASLANPMLEQSLRLEFAAQALALESADFAELQAARREGRLPAFTGR